MLPVVQFEKTSTSSPSSVRIGLAVALINNVKKTGPRRLTLLGADIRVGLRAGITWYLLLLSYPKPDPLNGRYPQGIRSAFWGAAGGGVTGRT